MLRQVTFPVGPLACNCTVLADEASATAIVIDPGAEVDRVMALLSEPRLARGPARLGGAARLTLGRAGDPNRPNPSRAYGWRLQAILVTHAHIDHIGGAAELKRRTGAPIWLNPQDRELYAGIESQAHWLGVPLPETGAIDGDLDARAKFELGGERFEVLETPGHTQGSVGLYVPGEGKLFAGDTLFAGSIGRTDFPGGNYDQIQRSLRDCVLMLPDATVVIPGHGPETTIGRERAFNPFLQG